MISCPVCRAGSLPFRDVSGYAFFGCGDCGLIHLDAATLSRIDAGEAVVRYTDGYWASELPAARDRAYGVALARAAEVVLGSSRPIDRFLDVGTGPGHFLDAVATYLPHSAGHFHGVELFPPAEQDRTRHPNYRVGRVSDYERYSIDGGMCIEVVEHLTPAMVDGLIGEIAAVSRERACFLINTGLADFVREEDPGYLDPAGRGHITIWTVAALNHLARRYGMVASAIAGRSWCVLLEKADAPGAPLLRRAESPLAENAAVLYYPGANASPVALLGLCALRESHHFGEFMARTRWALELDRELAVARRSA